MNDEIRSAATGSFHWLVCTLLSANQIPAGTTVGEVLQASATVMFATNAVLRLSVLMVQMAKAIFRQSERETPRPYLEG